MSFKTPILPRITWFELSGYAPLFDKTISMSIENNRLLILGGNGLGKTTILQSIMYCIAGEVDNSIEQDKNKIWGRKYFHGRISRPDSAYVSVEFFLGSDKILIKRGFSTARVLEFKLNDKLYGGYSAENDFENYLIDTMGYQSISDFRFLVHKLCYLPEDRSNLVWDAENQIKLMMLLFNDIIKELEFRDGRKLLKKLDSQRRHISVRLNAARSQSSEKSITLNLENNSNQENEIQETIVQEDNELFILEQLSNMSEEKALLQAAAKETREKLSLLAEEVELIQGSLSEKEEEFIIGKLNEIQSNEIKLALHKLIHRQLCPACGEKAEELAGRAIEFQSNSLCPLCGSKHPINKLGSDKNSYTTLESQLTEKLKKKFSLEQSLAESEKYIQDIDEKENVLQFKYNKIKLSKLKSDNFSVNADNLESSEDDLEAKVKELELQYHDFDRRFQTLKNRLEKKYREFSNIVNERIVRLGQLYQIYATSFLGVSCELSRKDADVKFLSMDLYVPKFNDQIRTEPETCSEAQRFFLDIAFRMSVIDLS